MGTIGGKNFAVRNCCFNGNCGYPAIVEHAVHSKNDDMRWRTIFCVEHDSLRNEAYYEGRGLILERTFLSERIGAQSSIRAAALYKLRKQPLPADVQAWAKTISDDDKE